MYLLKALIFAVKGLCRKPNALRKINIFALVVSALFATSQILADRIAENAILAFGFRWLWIPLSILFLIVRHGEILKRYRLKRFFRGIRFWGFDGKPPEYINAATHNRYLVRNRFKSRIHICEWEKIIPSMEMFFKRKIYKIENTKGNITIVDIFVIEGNLPSYIEWRDEFLQEGRKFAIGEGYRGREVWDATVLPHGLVAGATGSGKTGMLRCIIHQAIRKKFNVHILDFKGGGDYSDLERESIIISEPEEARNVLVSLIVEVRGRLEKFEQAGVSNIDEFNALKGERVLPWLLVIDEAAEILDVKPRDKAEKELYTEIDQSLRTLARISRAAGVHILLGIIRPSHEVIDGQIKNNILWRACGYFADSAASRIVLENDRATEFPPDIKGRFIIGDEEVQAYYLPKPKADNR